MPRPDVEPATELTPAQKLELSLQMFEHGRAVMRQNLRRAHPDASEDDIDGMLRAWLRSRPGAEHGDAVGPAGNVAASSAGGLRPWPRRSLTCSAGCAEDARRR